MEPGFAVQFDIRPGQVRGPLRVIEERFAVGHPAVAAKGRKDAVGQERAALYIKDADFRIFSTAARQCQSDMLSIPGRHEGIQSRYATLDPDTFVSKLIVGGIEKQFLDSVPTLAPIEFAYVLAAVDFPIKDATVFLADAKVKGGFDPVHRRPLLHQRVPS